MKKAIITSSLLSVGILFGASTATNVIADGGSQGSIDFRESVMTIFKWHLGPMGAMVKGKAPFDEAAFRKNADGLAHAANLDLLAGFPEGSQGDSEAKAEIWENWSQFEEKYGALRTESAKLAEVAAGGDQEAMKAQFGETAKTCKGCHDDFREQK